MKKKLMCMFALGLISLYVDASVLPASNLNSEKEEEGLHPRKNRNKRREEGDEFVTTHNIRETIFPMNRDDNSDNIHEFAVLQENSEHNSFDDVELGNQREQNNIEEIIHEMLDNDQEIDDIQAADHPINPEDNQYDAHCNRICRVTAACCIIIGLVASLVFSTGLTL